MPTKKNLLKAPASHSVTPTAIDSETRLASGAGGVRDRVEEREGNHVPAAGSSPYKTIPEAAEYLRVTPWTIAQAIRAGDLRPAKMGKRFILHIHDLDAYFQKLLDAA